MEKKFILVGLEEEKSKKISEVIGSKTCKKIIDFLSNTKHASAKEISQETNIPMNTMDYNLKKLLDSELIQKKKDFFWSKKGRKISLYELSNKSIIISPKKSNIKKLKSLIPAFLITGASTVAVYAYEKIKTSSRLVEKTSQYASGLDYAEGINQASIAIPEKSGEMFQYTPPIFWIWFLLGAMLTIFIFAIINWRKL